MVIKESATATVAITRLIRAMDDPMLRTVVLRRARDHPRGDASSRGDSARFQRVVEVVRLS
jgi:hypothetical protein